MANQQEISLTYNWMDRFFPRIFGGNADISCAFYDGDFSKSLKQAQLDKHDWILSGLGFKAEQKVLDIGSGWGNILYAIQQRGGHAVGLTLSSAQAKSCQKRGFQTLLRDWKNVTKGELGTFDAVVSIGAFEHFCSIEEYLAGKQEFVYRTFFDLCSQVLCKGGKLYLQTMTWGKRVPDPAKDVNLKAAKGTDEKLLGRLRIFYPGSWLPAGKNQIVHAASPYFTVLDWNNGRKDYIQTLEEWQRGIRRYLTNPRHWPNIMALLVLHGLQDRQFPHRLMSLLYGDQREVFRRELFDHYRMFLEKK